MKSLSPPLRKIRIYAFISTIIWTLVILTSLWINISQQRDFIIDVARKEAETNIKKDLIYRWWNTNHGGVYVPVTENTQPNPYLDVPEREVTTPSGRVLTLINPAYMTRQVYELSGAQGDSTLAHLTSLNPINPNNIPDPWERETLQSFEKGITEVSSIETLDGEEYMRVMIPFITEEACLKCHAQQGYKVGDVRGGLSVSVPMTKYTNPQHTFLFSHSMEFVFLWLVGIGGIFVVFRNVERQSREQEQTTERIQESHRQLLESEASLRFSQRVAHVGHWTWDTQTNKVVWSSEMYRIFGLDPVNFNGDVNQIITSAIHPDDQEKVYAANQNVVNNQKPASLEYRIIWQDGSIHTVWAVPGDQVENENGKIIKLGGIVQDITERKQIEDTLRKKEAILLQAQQIARLGYYLLDLQSGIWNSSEILDDIFGIEKDYPKTVEGWVGIVHPDQCEEMANYFAQEVIDKKIDFDREYRILRIKDQEVRWVHGLGKLTFDDHGNPIAMVGAIQDITERKRSELELQARESHLKQAQFLAQLGTWEWDLVTDRTAWSDEMLKIYGITREQFTGNGQDYINFTHPEDRHIQQSNIHKDFEKAGQLALETGQTVDDAPDPKEFRIIRPDGSICWVQGDAIEYVSEDGNPLRMLGILRDITKQKMDEQALRNSEEQYRLLFEEMLDGFALHEIICDESGNPVDYRFIAINTAFENLTGLCKENIVGKTVIEVLPKTEKIWIERYGNVALTGNPDHFEHFSQALNKYYEVRAYSPAPNKFATVFHDVSQRRHSENITLARMKIVEVATTHSLDKLTQTILDETERLTGSKIGFYHFMEPDQKTLLLQNWSTRTLKEFCHAGGKGVHYSVDSAGVWVDCVHKKRPVIHNDYASLPHRKGLPEGHATVTRELVVPVIRNEKIVAILGVGNKQTEYSQQDVEIVQQMADLVVEIVERKRAEEARSLAQQNYENLIQTVDGIVWEADAQTFQFSFVSDQAERILGYPPKLWIEDTKFWENHIHPDDRERAIHFCVEQTRAMQAHEFEYRMISKDLKTVWLRDVVIVITEDDRPVKLRGLMIDITEKKKVEERLHQLSLAVEQNPASVVITDLQANIEYVNPKFTQITGYSFEEAISQNPRILKSGKTSPEEYKHLWETITSGKVWQGEFHNRKKNGELFWEDAMIAPITDETGKITHYVAVKEDITERKRAEKEINEKNANLTALFSLSTHLRTASNANEMLPVVLREMTSALKSDANAVIMKDSDKQEFVCAMANGLVASNTGLYFSLEDSISGNIMNTRSPYISNDFSSDPNRTIHLKNYEDVGSAVLVPLQSETEFIGTLFCGRRKDSKSGGFTSSEVQLLSSIGEMVGNALRRARLYDDALFRLQRVQALRTIDTAMTSNFNLKITLNILLTQAIAIMEIDAADILTFNQHTLMLEYAVGQGFESKTIEQTQLRIGEGLAGQVALERKTYHTNDITRERILFRKHILQDEGIRSMFIVPMITKGQILGVLELYSKSPKPPDDEWMEFMEALATQAAIAIDSSKLYEDLQRSNLELTMAYDETIKGWSLALDLKDQETEKHTLRVTDWTVKLARMAGLSGKELVHIRRGALLHDIGKMGIPDAVLKKSGKLTLEEWDIMKQHPTYAYNMLHPIKFLEPAMDIPYCHHEKWDGTGYPRGLKANEIPYAARLFAVIDVWDALTSDRTYRAAWSHESAFDYIKSESGKQFDPDIVNLFTEMMKDINTEKLDLS